MVFPEGTLVKAETGFEGKGRPFGKPVRILLSLREVLNRLVNILNHMGEDYFTVVPRSIQERVIGGKFVVNPRHITESLHLVKVEICPEELGYACVFQPCSLVGTVVNVAEENVYPREV